MFRDFTFKFAARPTNELASLYNSWNHAANKANHRLTKQHRYSWMIKHFAPGNDDLHVSWVDLDRLAAEATAFFHNAHGALHSEIENEILFLSVLHAEYYFFSFFFTDRMNDRTCRPLASVMTKTSVFSLGFCLLSPSGQVFNSAWETMIKSYNKHDRNISIKWIQVQLATVSQQENSQYLPRSLWVIE